MNITRSEGAVILWALRQLERHKLTDPDFTILSADGGKEVEATIKRIREKVNKDLDPYTFHDLQEAYGKD